jgi:hypothetical protein
VVAKVTDKTRVQLCHESELDKSGPQILCEEVEVKVKDPLVHPRGSTRRGRQATDPLIARVDVIPAFTSLSFPLPAHSVRNLPTNEATEVWDF